MFSNTHFRNGYLFRGLALASTGALAVASTGHASANLLFDDFSQGYTLNEDIAGQDGGTNWAGGSEWERSLHAGASDPVTRQVTTDGQGNHRMEIWHDNEGIDYMGREYADPGLATYSLVFELEVFEYDPSGIDFDATRSWMGVHGGSPGNLQAGANATWMISTRGSDDDGGWTNENDEPIWGVHDGDPSSTAWQGPTSTGMTVESNTTYQFQVDFIGNDQYVVHIDNGSESVSTGPLGFRTTDSNDGLPHPFFNVHARTPDSVSNSTHWAVNNVSVIPEPGSLALLSVGAGLMLIRRRK